MGVSKGQLMVSEHPEGGSGRAEGHGTRGVLASCVSVSKTVHTSNCG